MSDASVQTPIQKKKNKRGSAIGSIRRTRADESQDKHCLSHVDRDKNRDKSETRRVGTLFNKAKQVGSMADTSIILMVRKSGEKSFRKWATAGNGVGSRLRVTAEAERKSPTVSNGH